MEKDRIKIFRPTFSLSYRIIGILVIIAGIGLIALAFIDPAMLVQIAIGLIGVIGILLGLLILRRINDTDLVEKRYDRIMEKLEEIQSGLQKEDQKGKTGIAIADVITSGLKYYSEQISRKDKDEK